jgi:murein DD-endopeptidase
MTSATKVRFVIVGPMLLVIAACGSAPIHSDAGGTPSAQISQTPRLGSAVARSALDQLGRPYRFGGNDPNGFDCSGLVRFAYSQLGINVPRTTVEQYRAARPISLTELMPGDLLFFKLTSDEVSHVGIYQGDGRFVHAPASGRDVEVRKLEGYFQTRLVGAGRFP